MALMLTVGISMEGGGRGGYLPVFVGGGGGLLCDSGGRGDSLPLMDHGGGMLTITLPDGGGGRLQSVKSPEGGGGAGFRFA